MHEYQSLKCSKLLLDAFRNENPLMGNFLMQINNFLTCIRNIHMMYDITL